MLLPTKGSSQSQLKQTLARGRTGLFNWRPTGLSKWSKWLEWPNWTMWKAALYKHYTAPQLVQFKSLRNGFILFAFGLAAVLIANNQLESSLQQELIVLFGLIIGGLGFVLAMMAYVRIVISRIVSFLNK